ncbi:hypothetical protein [Mucilaginibacter antarcticus]|uniref:hypothetical protein n=1 Tax=Mucilaginibacter antarcticus TaxID=1855725 RepID=UPI0036433DC3
MAKAKEDKTNDIFSFNLCDLTAGKYVAIVRPVDSWNNRIEGQDAYLDILVKPLPVIERKIPVRQILLYVVGACLLSLLSFGYTGVTQMPAW